MPETVWSPKETWWFPLEPFGALRLGAEHGLYRIGCCWAMMALLFLAA